MTYVALLRGINVGGNNKVEMTKLKSTFEHLGYTRVKTYIASGNVIFTTNDTSVTTVTEQISAAIEQDFGLQVPVLLRDLVTVEKLVRALPAAWVNDQHMRCDVLFLWPAIDSPDIVNHIPFNPEIEDVIYAHGAAIWRIDRDKVTRGQVVKIIGTGIYKQITIRNVNTVRKLYELMLAADKG